MDAFTPEHRVIRFDPRGFGRSERPDREYAHYEDMRAVLDAVGVDRVAAVGLSYGGRTAVDFALAYPARLCGLVLVNPGISGYTYPGLGSYFAAIDDAVRRDDITAFVEAQLRMKFDGPFRTSDQVDRRLRDEVARVLTEEAERNRARGTPRRLRELNASARLSEIRAPTLAVISALDQPDAHAIGELILEQIPGARRVFIEDAAHYVNLERPDAFAAAVLPFLAAHHA
jgi:pimeloyl-ACP methyl ester carboxylesterase